MGRISPLVTAFLSLIVLSSGILLIVFSFPSVVGKDDAFIVRSYSMEPALTEGSMIFVEHVSPGNVKEGDVITYRRGNSDDSILITHRVVEVSNYDNAYYYRMKGDANRGPDRGLVGEHQLIGKVTESYPKAGEAVAILKTPPGLLFFIIMPSAIVILKEFTDIRKQLKLEKVRKARKVKVPSGKVEVNE